MAGLVSCSKPQPPAPTSGAPTGQYRYVVLPTPSAEQSAPRILEIDLSDRNVTAPGPVAARVRTTDDVMSVSVRSMGRAFTVARQSPGLFEGTDRLPNIPFIFKGRTYSIDFVATDGNGRTVTQSVSVYLNR